jgi:DNA gyrase subunit A
MAILEHVDATPAERAAYLKQSVAERKAAAIAAGVEGEGVAEDEEIALTNEDVGEVGSLSVERYEELKAHEQLVLTVTQLGYGKRSSSYDFRLTGRGGKGIRATDVSKVDEIGPLVATFPVAVEDQIMLVTNGGQVIRVPVKGIRIASRATKGVTIFHTAEGEKVVSVERISEPQGDEAVEEVVEAGVGAPVAPDGPEAAPDAGSNPEGTPE